MPRPKIARRAHATTTESMPNHESLHFSYRSRLWVLIDWNAPERDSHNAAPILNNGDGRPPSACAKCAARRYVWRERCEFGSTPTYISGANGVQNTTWNQKPGLQNNKRDERFGLGLTKSSSWLPNLNNHLSFMRYTHAYFANCWSNINYFYLHRGYIKWFKMFLFNACSMALSRKFEFCHNALLTVSLTA